MIRPAVEADVPGLVGILSEFFESALSDSPYSFNAASVQKSIAAVLSNPSFAVLVSETGGNICGTFIGAMSPSMFDSTQVTAAEIVWFVREDSRGFEGLRLLRAFEEWAIGRGASLCVLAHLDPGDKTNISKVYSRMKYRPIEVHYIKEL